MKKIVLVTCSLLLFISCKKENSEIKPETITPKYASFGDKISADSVITSQEMLEKYNNLKEGDTLNVKFTAKIKAVCQKKGCWMNLVLSDTKDAFVRFKDYGFFMPKNASGSEAIVSGKAFVSVETVAELKHYAKDAGKSKAAIDSIVSPKTNFSFTANGVLIKQ